MGFHHVAVATKDLAATHRFFADVTGFTLVKVDVGASENPGGWFKHAFYDTGGAGGLLAFFEVHDDGIGDAWRADLSTGLGLPIWVNHLAFDAGDDEGLEARKRRWLDHGVVVTEMDHLWCRSVYAVDPNGIMVEFCCSTRPLTAEDAAEAEHLLADPAPPVQPPPHVVIHDPRKLNVRT